jgi:hypothetical protein
VILLFLRNGDDDYPTFCQVQVLLWNRTPVSGGDDAAVVNERQAAENAAHSVGTNVIAERDYE